MIESKVLAAMFFNILGAIYLTGFLAKFVAAAAFNIGLIATSYLNQDQKIPASGISFFSSFALVAAFLSAGYLTVLGMFTAILGAGGGTLFNILLGLLD